MEPIILASASPRRQEYFRLLGLPFTCVPSNADEDFDEGTDPQAVVEELAIRKVKKTLEDLTQQQVEAPWICGADTIVVLDGAIYGKPKDRQDAERMLRLFSGREHHVISAVALYNGRKDKFDCRSVTSAISFAPLSDKEIEWYLDSGEWEDAAGSYKIQGLASCFISDISGSYSSIVGLPLREFYVMLRDNGYPFGSHPAP
jgi:septum formation protein